MELNRPTSIELLYDTPKIGNSQYGEYYLYAVRNGDGTTEYSMFANIDVHEKLKDLKKGSRATITKLAEQKGSKIITKYEVIIDSKTDSEVIQKQTTASAVVNNGISDNFYEIMLHSCKDAVKIQNELGGLMDPKSVAVSLFIARSKVNGYGG